MGKLLTAAVDVNPDGTPYRVTVAPSPSALTINISPVILNRPSDNRAIPKPFALRPIFFLQQKGSKIRRPFTRCLIGRLPGRKKGMAQSRIPAL